MPRVLRREQRVGIAFDEVRPAALGHHEVISEKRTSRPPPTMLTQSQKQLAPRREHRIAHEGVDLWEHSASETEASCSQSALIVSKETQLPSSCVPHRSDCTCRQ